jgi:hypothetical protein
VKRAGWQRASKTDGQESDVRIVEAFGIPDELHAALVQRADGEIVGQRIAIDTPRRGANWSEEKDAHRQRSIDEQRARESKR